MNILPMYNGDKDCVRNALNCWVFNVDPQQVDRVVDSIIVTPADMHRYEVEHMLAETDATSWQDS